ncbi:hypothetical protein GETHLI_16980 [Geothrix limicola]|uniref:Cytochrome C Planctomycete-type domain-containing protein n=1 Tax=Geothrix limicola TaxID=2927978 RepID=A0ABQ5QFU3_9BACT|nr:hypothetical protein [Geothrix limicola]GLH73196.1 hypothetical protein GETHLI_16980 [Geothrix limicola]
MRLVLPALSALAFALACGGGGSSATPAPPAPSPSTCPITVAKTNPSFSADLVPAIQSSCGSTASSCHGGPSPTGHVSYSGTASQIRASLVNVAPANAPAGWLLVKPGDPAHSWIIEKVTKDQPGGSGYGTRMPQGAPNLCQPTVDTLSAWISAGAPDN